MTAILICDDCEVAGEPVPSVAREPQAKLAGERRRKLRLLRKLERSEERSRQVPDTLRPHESIQSLMAGSLGSRIM